MEHIVLRKVRNQGILIKLKWIKWKATGESPKQSLIIPTQSCVSNPLVRVSKFV